MGRDSWQLVAFIGVGGALWIGGYVIQRMGGQRSVMLHPPRWIAWLCGNPRGDGQIDLGDGGMQLLGFIWALGGPLLYLLGVEFRLRAAIVFLGFSVATLFWLLIMEWAKRRERRRN